MCRPYINGGGVEHLTEGKEKNGSYSTMICQICGKKHRYDDSDLDRLEYIPIICSCGTKTKIYEEVNIDGVEITP